MVSFEFFIDINIKWSRYRPGVAQRVGRGIALLFHDRGTRRWWVVSSTPRPHFTPGKDPVPILQEAGLAPGPVWTGEKISCPHRDSIPDRPAHSQWLHRLSYPAHEYIYIYIYIYIYRERERERERVTCILMYVYICIYIHTHTYVVFDRTCCASYLIDFSILHASHRQF